MTLYAVEITAKTLLTYHVEAEDIEEAAVKAEASHAQGEPPPHLAEPGDLMWVDRVEPVK